MNTEEIRSDWVGRVIDGRFTLLQWLGGSEAGGVFLTEIEGNPSHKAAIKLMAAEAADAEAHIAGWEVTATLSHPHLMRLFQTGRCEIDATQLLYAVTEYAEENLAEILPERPLTPTETREMLGPVIDALSYLHEKGLVHGHLKPSNILVVNDQLKLSSDSLHLVGELGKHSPALGGYGAPEGATETIAPAVDVWSLGVTLVEALTQHPPVWDRSTYKEPTVPESIPQSFAEIARECLRANPQYRCTLRDVKARLEAVQPLPAPSDETSETAPTKLGLNILIAVVLAVLAVIAVMQLRSCLAPSSSSTEGQQSAPATAAVAPDPPVSKTPPAPAVSPAPATQSSGGAIVKGAVAEQELPDLLPSAINSIQGQVNVKVRVTVDPSGKVSDATLDSPGPSKYFAKAALGAAQNWKFKPAEADGQPASSAWLLRFQFTRHGTEVTPVKVSP